MGLCSSYYDVYELENVRPYRRQFEALQLSAREVGKLYKIFKKVDVDGSGSIALSELLAHIDVERTVFSQRVFSIFDEDGSGEIDFREFVLALWNYCTLSRATLDLFAFDLYDSDSSGQLSPDEIQRMLKDIYGSDHKTNFRAKSIANELRAMDSAGEIDAEHFCKFAKTHHALLFPAFEMQTALHRATLGAAFWHRNAERRIEVSKGRFIPIAKFMELHLNRELYQQTVNHGAAITAPVKDKAMMALSVTGTKAMRSDSAAQKAADEAKNGFAENRPVMAPVRKTREEQAMHDRTRELSAVHQEIMNSGGGSIKMISSSPVVPSEQATASRKRRNLSQASIVPISMDEQGNISMHGSFAMGGSFSEPQSQSHAQTRQQSQSRLDDGNPSAKLALFADMPPKGSDKRIRRKSLNDPNNSNNIAGIASSVADEVNNNSGVSSVSRSIKGSPGPLHLTPQTKNTRKKSQEYTQLPPGFDISGLVDTPSTLNNSVSTPSTTAGFGASSQDEGDNDDGHNNLLDDRPFVNKKKSKKKAMKRGSLIVPQQ